MSDGLMLSLNRFVLSLIIGLLVWSLVIRSVNAAEVTDAKLNQWLENHEQRLFFNSDA